MRKTVTVKIPKIEKRMTLKQKTLELLSKKEYTVNEMATLLNAPDRSVRYAVQELKRTYDMTESRCRCGHSPTYTVKK